MNEQDVADRFAAMMLAARHAAGYSQEQAARAIGVSKTTIQNWENGVTSASQKQAFIYFQKMGLQPLPFYLQAFYHAEFNAISANSTDEQIDAALYAMLKDLPIDTKRKLLFVAYGDHGSSPISVLEMVVAHLHTPLVSRIGVASLILSNFKLARDCGRLVGTDHIMPSLDTFDIAIQRAREAVANRSKRYTI